MPSKLLKKGANKRINTVDRNVGVVSRHIYTHYITSMAKFCRRSLLDYCQTVDILSHGQGTNHLHGVAFIRVLYLLQPLLCEWEATFKPTRCTLAFGHLA